MKMVCLGGNMYMDGNNENDMGNIFPMCYKECSRTS